MMSNEIRVRQRPRERERLRATKDRTLVRNFCFARRSLAQAACGLVAALLVAPVSAQAQGKLDARYTASLAGVPIGKGAWVIDINNNQYTAAASGMTTGLMRMLASGHGTSASRGHLASGLLVPESYAASIMADKKASEVRMTLAKGGVREFVASPPSPLHPERIPLTAAHRRDVTDPMTGSLVRMSGNGNPVTPKVCQRTVAIFDGRLRYNLALAYKRMDTVKADKGYQGPVVVCAVYFSPIAGHIPDRPAIKYLAKLRSMEVWFAPVAGTRVLVPFRASVPTPIGLGVLQATQFVSAAYPARPIPTSAKAR